MRYRKINFFYYTFSFRWNFFWRTNYQKITDVGIFVPLNVSEGIFNHGTPKYQLPKAIQDLSIRFFEIEPGGKIKNGGLISLDGVHPTICGYAIAAQEFINVMRKQNPGIRDIDFAKMRFWDTLVSRPPRTLDDIFGMLEILEKWFHLSRLY